MNTDAPTDEQTAYLRNARDVMRAGGGDLNSFAMHGPGPRNIGLQCKRRGWIDARFGRHYLTKKGDGILSDDRHWYKVSQWKPPHTPVIALLKIVEMHEQAATRFSSERGEHAMMQAMSLAVHSGMQFDLDDFQEAARLKLLVLQENTAERLYAAAIVEGNISACRAWEQWRKRKPFMFVDVDPSKYIFTWAHMRSSKSRDRLAVGSSFFWPVDGHGKPQSRVYVTSFADDGESLVACMYLKDAHPRKIARRIRLTRADLQAEWDRRRGKTPKKP